MFNMINRAYTKQFSFIIVSGLEPNVPEVLGKR
jgi:hypothetical protein